jgi:outer membrane receptor for ferrienterochelin and colicin
MTRLAQGAAVSALLCAVSSAAYAQETTSAVHGVVTAGGKPVAGAAVSLVHTPSGTHVATASQGDGVFYARGLRVGGPYTITVSSPGQPPKVLKDIYLPVGKTTDIDVDLTGANEVEELVVTAAGVKDTEQGPKTVLTRQDIQEIVSVNRDPRDLARRDILVFQDLNSGARIGVNSGGVSIAGSNPRYNRISVDGVSAQDQFGLNQGGLTTARGPVNLDAIEQFAVAAVPTDVENGDFVGGALNMVLRSGTNSFHGAAFVNYLNDGLVGTQSEGDKIPSNIHQTNYGVFLSGPIWKDHVFFAGSYENYETVDVTPFGVTGSGAANIFQNNGGQATIDAVTNTFNTYASKFAPGSIMPTTPVLDRKYSAKLDWNINDDHRLSLSYRHAESSNFLHPNLGATTMQLSSQDYQKSDVDEATTLELHSHWTDKLSTTFKVTNRQFTDSQLPPSGQNFSDVRICTAASADATLTSCQNGFNQVFFGPDQFRHANALAEKELRIQFTGEYALAEHTFKFGGQARKAQPFDLFVPQSRGIYYFDSLADLTAGRADRLQYQNAVTGNPSDAGFRTTYWVYSLFGEDTWDLRDNLKTTFGLRYDWYAEPDRPVLNQNFTTRNGFTNQKTIDGQHVLMPRVSVEWRPMVSEPWLRNLKVSGGAGLFSGGTPDVLTGTPFFNTGVTTTSVDIQRTASGAFIETTGALGFTQAIGAAALNGVNTDPTFGFKIPQIVQQLQQGTLGGGPPALNPLAAVIALSPTFKMPDQWKFFLSGQWEVWDGWRLQTDFVYTKVNHDLTFFDSRAQPLVINGVQQFLPDGRIRYDGLVGTIAGRTSQNLGSNNDLIIANTSKGHSWTAAFTASKAWEWGGDVSFAYARQSLSDVTAGLFFGTTAGSLYGSVAALHDPNRDYLGRSVYEIENRGKVEFGYHHRFFRDNETRVNLFVEEQDGRPYDFSMADLTSGRGPVFGVTKTAQALYVPDLSNVQGLKAGLVYFASQADLDNFRRYVNNFDLPQNSLLNKYSKDNAPIGRVDLSLSQELPTLLAGHKLRVQADIRNFLNLLNSNWGRVAEYVDASGTSMIQLANVQCADANGAAQPATSTVCTNYRYSNVPLQVKKQLNQQLSLWYAQISIRYEF